MITIEEADNLYTYLNKGGTRKVYEHSETTVCKIPYTNAGINQNNQEIETYKTYKDTLPLAKINLDLSTTNFVVMEKVIGLGDEYFYNGIDLDRLIIEYSRGHSDRDKIYQVLKIKWPALYDFLTPFHQLNENLIYSLLFDVSSFNMGFRGEELVILDYGHQMHTYINPFYDEIWS